MLSWQPGRLRETRGFPPPPRNEFGLIINLKTYAKEMPNNYL